MQMAEIKLKIISNPYTKTVEYAVWDTDCWQAVNASNNPHSKLLSKDLVEGFFPFKVKDIVDAALSEYVVAGDKLSIEFEGASDEYQELLSISELEEYSGVLSVAAGEKSLRNARDVLPQIIEVFKKIEPLTRDAIKDDDDTDNDIRKFTEASSDAIPLCVVGNYSAGKSTFINALIGKELLPYGDTPVTAKVFQIANSRDQKRGRISVDYNGVDTEFRFSETGISGNQANNALSEAVFKACGISVQKSMVCHMNAALDAINRFAAKGDGDELGDLVKVEVPFSDNDSWGQEREYTIFDTPGSNTVSHEDHSRVLKEAMAGFSNGLPVYVTLYDALESADNKKLYDEIKQLDAIDERFAMVILNKADIADLPKGGFSSEKRQDVLDSATVRNLYAQGVYFVSSVLGLGSKTNGEFISDNYAEKYEDQAHKYSNPESRFYKTLYRYDILPGTMESRIVSDSEACENLVLANSGLYCIEREIDRFAEKYSAYNKCHQSEALLDRLIAATTQAIEERKEDLEKQKADREAELDQGKAELLNRLDLQEQTIKGQSEEQYPEYMREHLTKKHWKLSIQELRKRESELTEENRAEYAFESHDELARAAKKKIWDDLATGAKKVLGDLSLDSVGEVCQQLAENIEATGERVDSLREAGRKADSETSDELLEEIKKSFDDSLYRIEHEVTDASQEFWNLHVTTARSALESIATDSTILDEKERQEIVDIIMNFDPPVFSSNSDEIFARPEFEKGFKLGREYLFKTEKLNLEKLSRVFNREIDSASRTIRLSIGESHKGSFVNWLNALMAEIEGNITKYNPALHKYTEEIRRDTEEIDRLSNNLETLRTEAECISRMIGWE